MTSSNKPAVPPAPTILPGAEPAPQSVRQRAEAAFREDATQSDCIKENTKLLGRLGHWL
jgi:hypothetical protein